MTIHPISALSAGPLLHLRLQRISHTPLARLVSSFHVVPRRPCEAGCCGWEAGPIGTENFKCWRPAQHLPNEFDQLQADHWQQGQLQLRRTLGQDLFLLTVLAGSDIGERMPLANCRIEEEQCAVGAALDLCC